MSKHLNFTWSVFWRWYVVSFIPNFVGEAISQGLMHKWWIQIPTAFITLWLALIWFHKTESGNGRNHDALLNSTSPAGLLRSFSFQFSWSIFWRWHLVAFLLGIACSLVFPKSASVMMWVQQITPFPALVAALFWVQMTTLNGNNPRTKM